MQELDYGIDPIVSRVISRLVRNGPKRFYGLFKNVCCPMFEHYDIDGISDRFIFQGVNNFNFAQALCKVEIFGEQRVISTNTYNWTDHLLPENIAQNMIADIWGNGYIVYDPDEYNNYEHAFRNTYWMSPLEMYLRVRAGKSIPENIDDLHDLIAAENIHDYECPYFSVCIHACEECVKKGECFRNPPSFRNGYTAKKFQSLIVEAKEI